MPGLGFHEVMGGAVAGKRVTLRAAITIKDLAAFLRDPNHRGDLQAAIDWEGYGTGIPSTSGVFELFKPTADPKLKLMVYACWFEHDGLPYFFDGAKHVRSRSIFYLWYDTTTLFTTVYQGTDRTGKVVGTGVLSLGIGALAKMMLTFSVPDTSPLGRLKTLLAFGGFFLRELWDTYVRRTGTSTPH